MIDPIKNLVSRLGGPPVVPRDSDIRRIVANDPRFRSGWDDQLRPLDTSKNSLPTPEGTYPGHILASQRPVTREQAKTPRGLSGRSDVAWLHLGCVYEMLKLNTDVLSQYQIEHHLPHMHTESYCFDRQWLGGLRDWGTMLQGIESAQEAPCVRWLLNQLFVRRHQKTWWRLRRERIVVSDPSRPVSSDPADRIVVSVFLPLGNRGTTMLETGERPSIYFDPKVQPPEHLTPELDQFS